MSLFREPPDGRHVPARPFLWRTCSLCLGNAFVCTHPGVLPIPAPASIPVARVVTKGFAMRDLFFALFLLVAFVRWLVVR